MSNLAKSPCRWFTDPPASEIWEKETLHITIDTKLITGPQSRSWPPSPGTKLKTADVVNTIILFIYFTQRNLFTTEVPQSSSSSWRTWVRLFAIVQIQQRGSLSIVQPYWKRVSPCPCPLRTNPGVYCGGHSHCSFSSSEVRKGRKEGERGVMRRVGEEAKWKSFVFLRHDLLQLLLSHLWWSLVSHRVYTFFPLSLADSWMCVVFFPLVFPSLARVCFGWTRTLDLDPASFENYE